MIHGIGTDLVDIRRIEYLLERFGARFLEKVFTPAERARMEMLPPERLAPHAAKRFAAKEACAKALGTGIGAHAPWQGIEIGNDEQGRPTATLLDGAREAVAGRHGKAHVELHLSLSDEYPYAQAFAVLEIRHG